MPFLLDGNPSQGEISEAVNYLLSNFSQNVTADPSTGQITGPTGVVNGYLYKYMDIKYSDSFDGTVNFSDSPTNRAYYGLRNNDSPIESTDPADYVWYKVTGGFGTTKFLYYLTTGGRNIQFAIATSLPNPGWVIDSGSPVDLDFITSASNSPANFVVIRVANNSAAPTNAEVLAAIGRLPIAGDLCTVNYNSGLYSLTFKYTTGWAIFQKYITGDLIVANSITATNIAAGTITATQIASGTITAGQIASNTITAGQIASNTITAGQIASNTITAGQIASNTITASQIASNTITATQIAANTITAGQIASATITAGQIAANTITASQIAANTITAGQIAAGTITATQLAASYIVVGNAASDVNAGVTTINGGQITANTITAAKLNVSTLSAITANLGTVTAGELTIGSSPAISGNTMSGAGSHLYSDGRFALGNSSTNMVFDGTNAYLNGFNVAANGSVTTANFLSSSKVALISFTVSRDAIVQYGASGGLTVQAAIATTGFDSCLVDCKFTLENSGGSVVDTGYAGGGARVALIDTGRYFQSTVSFANTKSLASGTYTLYVSTNNLYTADVIGNLTTPTLTGYYIANIYSNYHVLYI